METEEGVRYRSGGGGQKLRGNRAIRAAGVVDGGGLTYVGVIQQLHDPHLPEEL